MPGKKKTRVPKDRDEAIDLARYGHISKDDAEAAAASNGWRPFEYRPPLPQFDPSLESRWSLIMAIAWIAWRDLDLVRENWAAFRAESTMWIFEEWTGPSDDGTKPVKHAGWFLKELSPRTVSHLSLMDALWEKGHGEPPATRAMPVALAKEQLWRALSDGRLAGEAFNAQGAPGVIPAGEWSFLSLYEERGKDVLKLRPLDPKPAYTDIRFKREDLVSLWQPIRYHAAPPATYSIDASMIEPITRQGSTGLVPLCCAIHWIMSASGTRTVTINDTASWDTASQTLLSLIAADEIEFFGLPRGEGLTERIPGHKVSLVRVLSPLGGPQGDIFLHAASHIQCNAYIDHAHWQHDFNDKLYESGKVGPTWTHLRVQKSGVLQHWPRRDTLASEVSACRQWLDALVKSSLQSRPKSKDELWDEANGKFKSLSRRQFDVTWSNVLAQNPGNNWAKHGPTKKSSVHRGK